MNNNIQYEKLIQEIYQDLLNKDGLTTEVKHNIKLKGKSATHQIDVYWEYTFGGVIHKVAIECKNYSKELSIGKIRDFYSVLSDVGNINGIIVTKVGYQKGAKEFAEHYGINLVVVRDPKLEDWEGRLRKITTNVNAISHHVKEWFIQLDYDWCVKNIPKDKLNSVAVSIDGMSNEIWIYNGKGDKLKNFQQLQGELPYLEDSLVNNKHFYEFDDAFVNSKDDGHIKIKGIQIKYDTSVSHWQWEFDSQEITKAIFKNVLTGEMKFIKKQ